MISLKTLILLIKDSQSSSSLINPILLVEKQSICSSESLEKGRLGGAGRLSGNLELLNYARWTENGVELVSEELKKVADNGKLTLNKIAPNPDDYKKYRDYLMERVTTFIKE